MVLKCYEQQSSAFKQPKLGPEPLAQVEVDERVQGDVEHWHHDGDLRGVVEELAPGTAPQIVFGKKKQVVGHEAEAEDTDQR